MSPAPDRVLQVLPDADAVARRAAGVVAAAAREAIASRGRFTFAVSGGETPWAMFKALAEEDVLWHEVGIWQVDERVAPHGDPDRNLTSLVPVIPAGADLRPMPVTEPDLAAAADRYAASLPAAFELVHLGIGDDGHTASLVPGDPVLDVTDRDVAVTGEYRGLRRVTVTYPVLDRAGLALWMITGSDKAPMVPRLLAGDRSIPAGRVATAEQLVLVDAAAAAEVVAPS
ncbi:MAG TPA: 6-phosphogluconolactonase [Actinomycetota bacterium]|nr:6-phosphogluconolactonase [Actinomycetota bacterium]